MSEEEQILNRITIYCKIEEATMTSTGEGVLIFTKDKKDTLETTIKLLKNWEGKDVAIFIVPFYRRELE